MSSAPPAGSSPPGAPDTAAAQTSPSKRPTIKPMTQSAFTPGREPQPATEGAGEPEPHDTTAPAPPTATAASGAIPPWLAVQAAPEDVEAAAQLRTIIPMIHPAMIGAVLQSLVDDIPKLAPIVRSRCEVAMSLTNAAVNAAAASMPSPYGGGSSSPYFPNAPFLNPAAAAFNAIAHQQQLAAMAAAQAAAHGDHHFGGGHPYGSGNTTPSGHRRPSQPQPPRGAMSPSVAGRGLPSSEIGETDVCAIHNAVRSRKHLHINPVTRQKECVHGFHCLETNSNFQTPTKAAARDASAPTGTGSNPPTPIASAAPKAAPVAPMDDAEVKRLQDLLSTVRQTQQST